jgi:iron-sulfur cluster assembly accessory protein
MLSLTDTAALKAAELLAREQRDDLVLRVAVQPGGCAGLRYQLYFDDRSLDGDMHTLFETVAGPLEVRIDKLSAPYLQDATVDFVERIDQVGFTIDNPAASGACSCGDSFS